MSAISAMPGAIVEWLGGQQTLDGIRFLTEYPAENKAVPLRSPIVAVGLGSVSITDKFIENNNGVLERQEYCRTASLRMRFDIHVPFSEGGSCCHEIFTKVLDLLTFASDLNLRASGCADVSAHRDTDAFVLGAWAEVTADFCPAESTGLTLASFLPKELLCGSHIVNQEIHLTAPEKARLAEPFVMGTYLGDGLGIKNIAVGFRPSCVFVWCSKMPAVHPNFTTNTAQSLFGCVVDLPSGDGNSMGMEIIPTGFRLRTGSTYNVAPTISALNLSGTAYVYLAIK